MTTAMALTILNLNNTPLAKIGSNGRLDPPEGPRTLGPLTCAFSGSNSDYHFDLTNLIATGQMSSGLTVFVVPSSSGTTIITTGIGQQIQIPSTVHGAYIPLLAPNPCVLDVSNTLNAGTATLYICNFLIPGFTW